LSHKARPVRRAFILVPLIARPIAFAIAFARTVVLRWTRARRVPLLSPKIVEGARCDLLLSKGAGLINLPR
jgi:hypothetical protein